jgi:hypothetical protein
LFARFDYNGVGLYHSVLATEIRCHMLVFSFTSTSPTGIQTLADTLNRMSFPSPHAVEPVCIRDYVTPLHLLHRVNPEMTGPRFAGVPVRIVINAQGKVEHVHPIGGFPEQTKSTVGALSQWVFKPYEVNGKPVAVETGLLFEFQQAP